MSDDINKQDKPRTNVNDDLVASVRRGGRAGWIAFFITLGFLLIQNLIFSLKPPEVMASENGKVIGQVIFDEARIRSGNKVLADFKNWVVNCVSVNKVTIMEDTSQCLVHMEEELSEARVDELIAEKYVVRIEKTGCVKVDYVFDPKVTRLIDHDRAGYDAVAELKGSVICKNSGNPISQDFYIKASARLVDRSVGRPLALSVYDMEDM